MVLVRSAGVLNSHRQPWRGTLSLSTDRKSERRALGRGQPPTVQDRTDPSDMESMLKTCVLTLVLAWRVGAAVEPEVSFSGPACLAGGANALLIQNQRAGHTRKWVCGRIPLACGRYDQQFQERQ